MAVVLERNLNEPSLDGSSAIFDKSTLQASKQKRSKNCLVLVPVYTTVAVLFFWPIAFLFFGSKLLEYVSRAVCPSVS